MNSYDNDDADVDGCFQVWDLPSHPWPGALQWTVPVAGGNGMCASLAHDVFIVSCVADMLLHVRSLVDGAFVRTLGVAGQFAFDYGGLCVTSADTVLVAERSRNRVQVCVVDRALARCAVRHPATTSPDSSLTAFAACVTP